MRGKARSKDCGSGRSKAIRGPRRAARAEKGFTLIELLIVTSVMPIIVGAISGGLLTVLSLQTSTASRLADTGDGQVVSSTFIKDVQSATFITTLATSSPQCDSSAGYKQLLGLQWGNSSKDIQSGSFSNPSTLISYDLVPVTSGSTTTYSLVREVCSVAGGVVAPASGTIVSNDVALAQPPPCYSNASCNPYDPNPLRRDPPIGWTSPSATKLGNKALLVMSVVKFVITEVKTGLAFTLTANSLSWTPADANSGTVGPAFSPLTLLGQASGTVLSMSGASILTITGTGVAGTTVAIASPFDASVSIPADADLTASTIFTEDPNLFSLTGLGQGPATREYYASSISDPLTSIFNSTTAPSSISPSPPPSCPVVSGIYTCTSGLYTTDPGFPKGSHVCFCDGFGNYEFASTFIIPLNSTITFDEGEYAFDGSPAIAAVSPPKDQTLAWTNAPNSTAVGSTYTPTASSTDSAGNPTGLAANFSFDSSSSGCTPTSGSPGTFTFKSGTCVLDANQPGNASFNPADQIQQVIAVPSTSLSSQTITFSATQPSPANVGNTYTLSATTSGTGLSAPVITSATSGVCTYSTATGLVTFNAAGLCLINANQGGNSSYLPAPEAQQAIVVIAGSNASIITGNNVLFYIPPQGGSVDFGNTSSVDLTPLASGLTIWDASSNAAASVTINNVADNRNTYGGIYIPGGNVNATTTSLSGAMSVMYIVANALNMQGQTTLNVTGP